MSEATIQARLVEALAPLVAAGSVLVNDHKTPQATSRERSPWLVIETSDGIKAETPNFANVAVTYEPYVAVVVFPRGDAREKAFLDEFQALRQQVIATLMAAGDVESVETVGGLALYFNTNGLIQRLRARVVEYEV